MADFDRKWTDDQKHALYLLADHLGTVAKARVELAERGYPNLDVEPVTIPVSTCREIVRVERKRRAGQTYTPNVVTLGAAAALAELTDRMVSILDREVNKLAGAQASGKLDIARLERAASTAIKLKAAIVTGKGPEQSGGKGAKAPEPAPSTFADALASDPPASADPSPPTPAPMPPAQPAPPASALAGQTTRLTRGEQDAGHPTTPPGSDPLGHASNGAGVPPLPPHPA